MPTGRLKFFNEDRGYGFIVPDGGGSDVFVHVHEVEAAAMKTLVAGQLLTYETAPARDGRTKAVHLRLLNPGGLETSQSRRQLLANAAIAAR
jgi:cold shock protein